MAEHDPAEIEKLKKRHGQLMKKIEKLEALKLDYTDREQVWEREKRELEQMLRTKTGELAFLSELLNRKL